MMTFQRLIDILNRDYNNENPLLMIKHSRAFLNSRIVNITLHFPSKNLHQNYLTPASKTLLSIYHKADYFHKLS